MTEIERYFKALDRSMVMPAPIIACFYTGSALPTRCAPMPRDPEVNTGVLVLNDFQSAWLDAIRKNPAIHDGAVMCGRTTIDQPYQITGWSFRLFPENAANAPSNRGSAFNSCLAMSLVPTVDGVYLVTRSAVVRFEYGRWTQVAT